MKSIIIGAHLHRQDIEPVADAIPVNDLWLSGVAVDDDQPLGDRELLLRVAQTRAALLDRATFIAIRYGWALRTAGEAAAKCAPQLERWRETLIECRDMVEMTLKVAATSAQPRPDRHDFSSGSAYLRALHEATRAAGVDPEFRDAAESRMTPLATNHRWNHRDSSSLELAMLVKGDAVPQVNEVGQSLKRDFAEIPFLLSGPWPLEVFGAGENE